MELNILRKKIETLILKDETYASQMEHLVLPFLISRKEGFWLAREDNPKQKIYCAKYTYDCSGEKRRGIVID